jgi:hypothetical protein
VYSGQSRGRRSGAPFPSDEFFKIEWRRWTTLFAFDECHSQSLKFGFLFFKQSQPSPHHIAGAAIAAHANLSLNEAAEMLTKAE